MRLIELHDNFLAYDTYLRDVEREEGGSSVEYGFVRARPNYDTTRAFVGRDGAGGKFNVH